MKKKPNPLDRKISFFPANSKNERMGTITLGEHLHRVESGSDDINDILLIRDNMARNSGHIGATNEKQIAKLEEGLSTIMPCCTIDGRRSIEEYHNGAFVPNRLLYLEIKKESLGSQSPNLVRDDIMRNNQSHALASYLTPALYIAVFIPISVCEGPEDHRRAFSILQRHYAKFVRGEINTCASRLDHRCVVSYDPDIKIRESLSDELGWLEIEKLILSHGK